MIKLRSKWYERDFFELNQTNILNDIVILYGAYLKYTSEIGDLTSFPSYYKKNKEKMSNIFANTTNRKMKSILQDMGIKSSGRKMRRLCITNKKRIIISYPWICDYFEILISNIVCNNMLSDLVYDNFLKECTFCLPETDLQYILQCCLKKILGFQYALLDRYSKNAQNNKKKRLARAWLDKILAAGSLETLSQNCKVYNSEGKKLQKLLFTQLNMS